MTGKPATRITLCIALLGALGACATPAAQSAAQTFEDCGASIVIRIGVDGDLALVEFANGSGSDLDLRTVPDRPEYLGGLPGTISIQVQRDKQVLSERDGARDGWWSPAVFESRLYSASDLLRSPVRAGETRQWRVEWRGLLGGLRLPEATGSEHFRLRTDFGLADGTRITCESRWLPLDS